MCRQTFLNCNFSFKKMSSMSKNSLFPHDEIREGQDALIKDLQSAVNDGKILIAHAPTGLGKTANASILFSATDSVCPVFEAPSVAVVGVAQVKSV